MKPILYFHREHQALLRVLVQFDEHVERVRRGTLPVGLLLPMVEDLGQTAMLHIVTEDADFYPRVARCGHEGIRRRILQLRTATGGIDRAFQAHFHNWPLEKAKQNLEACLNDIVLLTTMLRQRIQGEEAIFQEIESQGIEVDLESIRPSVA